MLVAFASGDEGSLSHHCHPSFIFRVNAIFPGVGLPDQMLLQPRIAIVGQQDFDD